MICKCLLKVNSLSTLDTGIASTLYPANDFSVSKVIIHPDYNSNDLCNDVGLLILEADADVSLPHVGLACLPATSGLKLNF